MKTETVKGFKDYTGEEAEKRCAIKQILVDTFEKYGFEPAETPIIEYEEFVRGENSDDEAVSDIYRLTDKGNRKLALRYELTFPLKRIMKNKKLPYKRYQMGPVFRDEPASTNRLRQFVQCDVDTIGSTVKDEAEVLAIVKEALKKLKIEFEININNRNLINEILDEQKVDKVDRIKVIREVDKLDKQPEDEIFNNLRPFNAQGIIEIFKKPESYFEKYKAFSEIKELQEYCEMYGVKVNFQPSLARGLSYYNGSVFEVKTKEIKETITAGGSFMFNEVQSTGLSFGLARLSSLAKIDVSKEKFLILSLSEDKKAIEVAEKLRRIGKRCIMYYGKPSKALEYANSKKISKVIFVGKEELKKNKLKIKDLDSGKEELVSESDIIRR
ncbi:MAG: ATP phosphoribosyltransferase regulatory subunit [archaeon]